MIRLTMFPARDGDSLFLEYGSHGPTRRILIDGGRADTYPDIRQPLADAAGDAGLDLLVVTHIDQDHVLGILRLFDDRGRVPIRDVWFNGFGHLSDSPFEAFGAQDGELLTTALLTQQVNWNRAFATHPVEIGRAFTPLEDGATITIVSPDRNQLEALIPEWTTECAKHGLIPGQHPEAPPPPGFESFGPVDVDDLADQGFERDSSAPNQTSIGFLFEFEGVRILFTGDADDQRLIDSIRPLAEVEGGRLRLDALKVPHHGSRKNLSIDFLDLIDCGTYLISTSGARHGHPDPVAIARILKHGGAEKRLVFNYMERAMRWEIPRLKADYGYSVVKPPGPDGFQTVVWPA
jgi:beta-lactamase superfamily II metal-dependent hydrolase